MKPARSFEERAATQETPRNDSFHTRRAHPRRRRRDARPARSRHRFMGRRPRHGRLSGRARQAQPADRGRLADRARDWATSSSARSSGIRCSSARCCRTASIRRFSIAMKAACISAAMSTARSVSLPGHGARVRTDVSITLFLSPPEEYDGGELRDRRYVRRAGSEAAARGTRSSIRRRACIRCARSRAVRACRASSGCRASCATTRAARCCSIWIRRFSVSMRRTRTMPRAERLVGCYHNLLRIWSDT